jgi:molybdenum cofactor cytidylyltransferase
MVSGILLGAGESKRMGRNKLSLPWGKRTIFEHCLRTLLRSDVREVIVVLSHRIGWMGDPWMDQRVKVVNNPYSKMGMSTSIRRGLQAIDPSSRGILIALGDQPLIKTRTINALIHAFVQGRGTIVIPSFRGKQGHPVIFHCRYLKELLKLRGDVGGRSIIEKHPEEVWLVRVKSEGVMKDIDTWEDYHPHQPISPHQVGRKKGRGKR